MKSDIDLNDIKRAKAMLPQWKPRPKTKRKSKPKLLMRMRGLNAKLMYGDKVLGKITSIGCGDGSRRIAQILFTIADDIEMTLPKKLFDLPIGGKITK